MAITPDAGFNVQPGHGLTSNVEATFRPEIWTSQLLRDLEQSTVLAAPEIVNRSYEGEFRRGGDTIHIPHFLDTVNVYDAVGAYDNITDKVDRAALEYISMTVQKGCSFHLEIDKLDQLFTQPGIDKMTELVRQRGRQAAIKMDQLVATTVKFAATESKAHKGSGLDYNAVKDGAAPTDEDILHGIIDNVAMEKDNGDHALVYETLISMMQNLDLKNAPADRFLVVSPAVRAALLRDQRFIEASKLGRSVIPTGTIGTILGVDVRVSNALGNLVPTSNPGLVKTYSTDAQGIDMLLGSTNALSVVTPFAEMQAYKPEASFTDRIKSRVAFDAKVIRPEQLVICPADPR
ncbi:phage major capsid protein [Streptomyces sp. WZ-12]|uniref:phage major capsid protein n=1 Tax=Streptomyces sp. WZ-12 TaxID=3030210 RepID=UPI0023818CB1|nr:hypothetical protein [Streptomyces sp. WZ-12]